MRDDAEEINDRLTAGIEGVLDALASGWVRRGAKAYLTPKHKGTRMDLGSFQVNIAGPRKGTWYRHSRAVGGGPIKLVAYLLNNAENPSSADFRDAFQWARRHLGMSSDTETEEQRERREAASRRRQQQQKQAEAEEIARRKRRAGTAQGVWEQCVPIAGTLAERYLIGRGIPVPPMGWPDVLGFHEGLEWELGAEWAGKRKVKDGPTFPALVAQVQDLVGETIAVWRIFIDPETADKAPVEKPKVGMGPAGGGAVRIGGIGPHIGAGEGVETSLAVWTLEGYRFPVWATLSTSGMSGFEIPIEVERLSIFPDGDMPSERDGRINDPPGMAAAHKLATRAVEAGIPVVINDPPFDSDFLDVLASVQKAEKQDG